MNENSPHQYPSDVRIVELDGRILILVGTAHISHESVDLVREVITRERPDCVCVELDQRRHQTLSQKRVWEELDLREVIRNRQLATLLVNLILTSYQKQLGGKLGIVPGTELLEAIKAAEEGGIPFSLCDRDIRVTLRRAWHTLSLFRKAMLASLLLAAIFEKPEFSEEDLRRIRQQDVLSELMQELGKHMPVLKRVLIDERDAYLAQKIREAPGNKIVAVVGAGHLEGMFEALVTKRAIDLDELDTIPPISLAWKAFGWSLPLLIVGSILYIGWSKGAEAAGDNALYWILANSIPSAIGCAIALAHPLTIVAGFLAAPFTSLTPLVGAGYVTSFVQAYVRPPFVYEIQSVSDDIVKLKKWWGSRLLKVFLVLILTSIGSLIGTWVGGIEIVSNLF